MLLQERLTMREINIDTLLVQIASIINNRGYWFRWRGSLGKIKLTRPTDIKQEIQNWLNEPKTMISWKYDESGYNIIISAIKRSDEPARILGGIACEERGDFEKIYDILDGIFDCYSHTQ